MSLRFVISGLGGGALSLVVFYFMATLVSGTYKLPDSRDNENFIDFVRIKHQDHLETKSRQIPKKPPPPKAPPKIQKLSTEQSVTKNQNLNIEMPKLSANLPKAGDGPIIGAVSGGIGGDRIAVPLFRIEPIFPREYLREGVQGSVVLSFDIKPDGTTTNIKVLDIKPSKRYHKFGSQARKAFRKWKFSPKLEDNKPVMQKDLTYEITFKLEGN